jgi:hypothetical protein
MQGSLPAGGLAFTGRELNPLDRYKRFQITHSPLLDLSWRKKGLPSSLVQLRTAVWTGVYSCHTSSGPEDFHLGALPEPDVNLSIHPAPVVRPFP